MCTQCTQLIIRWENRRGDTMSAWNWLESDRQILRISEIYRLTLICPIDNIMAKKPNTIIFSLFLSGFPLLTLNSHINQAHLPSLLFLITFHCVHCTATHRVIHLVTLICVCAVFIKTGQLLRFHFNVRLFDWSPCYWVSWVSANKRLMCK